MSSSAARWLLVVSITLVVPACSDDGDDPSGKVVLAGVARRTAGVTLVGDGKGTLCATVVSGCPTPDNTSIAPVLGGLSVGGADLSEETSSVSFRFEIDRADLAPGNYYLFGLLRESGGSCEGSQASGDLISVLLFGGASCPELNVDGGNEISGLELYLNLVVP